MAEHQTQARAVPHPSQSGGGEPIADWTRGGVSRRRPELGNSPRQAKLAQLARMLKGGPSRQPLLETAKRLNRPAQAPAQDGGARPRLSSDCAGGDLLQGAWITDSLEQSERSADLAQAEKVLRSGVMFTEGPGVALYRLAIRDDVPFDIEFTAYKGGRGTGGTTSLTYQSGALVSGVAMDGNVVVDRELVSRSKREGLKVTIKINTDSQLNATVGGIINTFVHEFAVHAVEYYQTVKVLLLGTGEEPQRAAAAFAEMEGAGEPPVKKFISALMAQLGRPDEHDVEYKSSEQQHRTLGEGGTPYYKDLVRTISDTELNTIYHNWWTKNKRDFDKAQQEDVKGHHHAYNPQSQADVILNIFDQGESLESLSTKSSALAEAAKLFKTMK